MTGILYHTLSNGQIEYVCNLYFPRKKCDKAGVYDALTDSLKQKDNAHYLMYNTGVKSIYIIIERRSTRRDLRQEQNNSIAGKIRKTIGKT